VVSLSAIILLWGLVGGLRRSPAAEAEAAREAMLAKMVGIERDHEAGDLDQPQYEAKKKELRRKLRGVWQPPSDTV